MITPIGFTYNKFNFPVGEKHIEILKNESVVSINWEYENDSEVFEMLLLCDALKRIRVEIENLYIPYVPYSRQDRINKIGEPLSISVFCKIINQIEAKNVYVIDPHSDVTTALINNVIVKGQCDIFSDLLKDCRDSLLICPDAGALKKVYKISKMCGLSVIECSKKRDTNNGEISGVVVHSEDLENKDCYIVDDICDGGRTFIEIAKALKEKNARKVVLMVTHGFFTKGIGVFDGLIDEIYTRKGNVK